MVDERLRKQDWPEFVFAEPPAGSDLKPVLGNAGLPLLGHIIEIFRGTGLHRRDVPQIWTGLLQRDAWAESRCSTGAGCHPEVFSNRNKDFTTEAWQTVIGPFFKRGLLLMDFDEHMYHRRIMQEAFTRTRLSGYIEHIDRVTTKVVNGD